MTIYASLSYDTTGPDNGLAPDRLDLANSVSLDSFQFRDSQVVFPEHMFTHTGNVFVVFRSWECNIYLYSFKIMGPIHNRFAKTCRSGPGVHVTNDYSLRFHLISSSAQNLFCSNSISGHDIATLFLMTTRLTCHVLDFAIISFIRLRAN